MGLFGQSHGEDILLPEQKFDYINLNDFHPSGSLAGFAYFSILVGLIVSFGAHFLDVYTAINLLVFDRWSSKLKPAIEFSISKWIFAGCIILSFSMLAIEWIIAIRAIRGNGVADIYLNRIAQRWCSLLGGRGRKEDTGWKRFLVFAELTKSKKGVDYVALFTYFSFQGWIRIVFAEGPRQVINTITLIAVFEANLIPKDVHKGEELSAIVTFFKNYKILASQDTAQALILGSMAFTLIVWAFVMLQLFIAALLYIFFLCHVMSGHIGLSAYCKERVDGRLSEIVVANHRKALAKSEPKLGSSGPQVTPQERQPTIPLGLGRAASEKGFAAPQRVNTIPTLPNIESLEKAVAQSRLGNGRSEPRLYGLARNMTDTSLTSASSTTGLLTSPAELGYNGRRMERAPTTSSANSSISRAGDFFEGSSGRPSPAPSRNQMGPPLQPRQQYGNSPTPRNTPGPYQQSQHLGRQPMSSSPNGDYFSDYSIYPTSYNFDQHGSLQPPVYGDPFRSGGNLENANMMFDEYPSGHGTFEYPKRAATAPPRDNMQSPLSNPSLSGITRAPLARAFTDARAPPARFHPFEGNERRIPFIGRGGEKSELNGRRVGADVGSSECYEMTTQMSQRSRPSPSQEAALDKPPMHEEWKPFIAQEGIDRAQTPLTLNEQEVLHERQRLQSSATQSKTSDEPSRAVSTASSQSSHSALPNQAERQQNLRQHQQYIAYHPKYAQAVNDSAQTLQQKIVPPQRSQTVGPYDNLRDGASLNRSATAPPTQQFLRLPMQQPEPQELQRHQDSKQSSQSYDP